MEKDFVAFICQVNWRSDTGILPHLPFWWNPGFRQIADRLWIAICGISEGTHKRRILARLRHVTMHIKLPLLRQFGLDCLVTLNGLFTIQHNNNHVIHVSTTRTRRRATLHMVTVNATECQLAEAVNTFLSKYTSVYGLRNNMPL